jgi:hypothetical protein
MIASRHPYGGYDAVSASSTRFGTYQLYAGWLGVYS